uniref:NAD kinase n=1 Tax=Uncultured archaeon GZfos26G2 TaxID=3386331 RepID=Q64AB4_UNCAG|nr:probable inorganic polyphosphate/ATP-NAD kinase [uncultured archaeon GZfos32E7]
MNLIQPKRIGMVCRGEPKTVSVLKDLIECVEGNAEVILEEEIAYKLKMQGMRIEDMDVDFLICVGGDGTILRALHSLKSPIPVLGINMGAIGFLAAVQPKDCIPILTELLDGFEVERRERLSVELKGKKERIPYAMNEAVVITSKPGKMLHFAIFLDDEELEELRADGVIFATPTGSTAYAMSAGGPIVDPKVNATLIVPIAPFKLSARPTVVDIKRRIGLDLFGVKDAELVIDGQFYMRLEKEDGISITRGEPAFFVKVADTHFLKLGDKLRSEGGK